MYGALDLLQCDLVFHHHNAPLMDEQFKTVSALFIGF